MKNAINPMPQAVAENSKPTVKNYLSLVRNLAKKLQAPPEPRASLSPLGLDLYVCSLETEKLATEAKLAYYILNVSDADRPLVTREGFIISRNPKIAIIKRRIREITEELEIFKKV